MQSSDGEEPLFQEDKDCKDNIAFFRLIWHKMAPGRIWRTPSLGKEDDPWELFVFLTFPQAGRHSRGFTKPLAFKLRSLQPSKCLSCTKILLACVVLGLDTSYHLREMGTCGFPESQQENNLDYSPSHVLSCHQFSFSCSTPSPRWLQSHFSSAVFILWGEAGRMLPLYNNSLTLNL